MPYIRIWIHIVFSVKHRRPLLAQPVLKKVIDHIRQNALQKKIWIDCMNGYDDHLHILLSLGNDQNISKIVQLIKGESSFWINKQNLSRQKFEWQDEYFAVSVSESQVNTLRAYINNQAAHHQKKTFAEEYDHFILKYNFERVGLKPASDQDHNLSTA